MGESASGKPGWLRESRTRFRRFRHRRQKRWHRKQCGQQVTRIIDGLQVLAAAGVLASNQLARWFGVPVIGLSATAMMSFIPAYPFWALVIIAVDAVARYGLCAYGSRANVTAA